MSGSLSGVWVGAPVRLFRPYEYSLFELDGRYWLGRRNRAAGGDLIPVAGPLAPPAANGLIITYYDLITGSPTTNRLKVGRVDIKLRAPTNRTMSDPAYRDLSTSTQLRNNP